MNNEQKLQKLIDYLEQNGINVKSDRGSFKGGLVRYHEEKYFYFNRKLNTEGKIALILNEMKEIGLDTLKTDNEFYNFLYALTQEFNPEKTEKSEV